MMDTILVVDDEPANLAILREALKDDYRVLVALGGAKALEMLGGPNPPDLVLLDVNMPAPDGFEVCRRMQAETKMAGIPVIFVSAAGDVGSKTAGFEAGGVDYVTKPFEVAEVLARVATHLELKRARERLERQNKEILEAVDFREEVERITRHDLKGPLQGMMGLPELMLDEPNLTADQRENLNLIRDSARRMLLMINSSLDLFKMEKGLYKLSPKPVPLAALFANVTRGREDPWAEEERFSIAAGPEAIAAGEELLLYSLFYNLVQNAWEASPREARIDIAAVLAAEGKTIHVTIRNAGEVPETMRGRFFDKFATAGKDKGTGIGTYSARLIVDTHGGTIAVDVSEPGHTTLAVDLPAWQASAPKEE